MLLSALIVSASIAAMPAPPRERKQPGEGGIAGASCVSCAADLNGDGGVNAADLSILLGAWGGTGSANLDGSGVVNAADLSILLGAWGPCPGAPVNDHCNQAIALAPGVHPFCTFGADTDGPPLPGSGGCNLLGFTQVDHDVWYSFDAPANGVLHVSTCGTTWDTKIAVYGSNIPGLAACPSGGITFATFLACSDDNGGCSLGSDLTIPVEAGEKYKIRVGGFYGHSGEGSLTLEYTPEGIDCENSIDLDEPFDITVTGSNLWTPSGPDPENCVIGDDHSVWYRIMTPCHLLRDYTVSTCHPGTNFDTVLTIWRIGGHGECAQSLIDCNDDYNNAACDLPGIGRKSRVSFQASVGWIYYVQVSGYQGATGNFELSITLDPCS
ncbi:MAG: hypothetical protein JNL80_06650 [Phycisphaerae bacterium]|jgi:hypothetical protein|nr:hypothetical protein [Phycisphaerae bacterium]